MKEKTGELIEILFAGISLSVLLLILFFYIYITCYDIISIQWKIFIFILFILSFIGIGKMVITGIKIYKRDNVIENNIIENNIIEESSIGQKEGIQDLIIKNKFEILDMETD